MEQILASTYVDRPDTPYRTQLQLSHDDEIDSLVASVVVADSNGQVVIHKAILVDTQYVSIREGNYLLLPIDGTAEKQTSEVGMQNSIDFSNRKGSWLIILNLDDDLFMYIDKHQGSDERVLELNLAVSIKLLDLVAPRGEKGGWKKAK